jgi:hypothetical protein
VIDITLKSYWLLEIFKEWKVSSEPSLLDNRHTVFTLEGSVPASLIRNLRGTNWDSFQEGLNGRQERGPEINMKDEAGLGLTILVVQQALI